MVRLPCSVVRAMIDIMMHMIRRWIPKSLSQHFLDLEEPVAAGLHDASSRKISDLHAPGFRQSMITFESGVTGLRAAISRTAKSNRSLETLYLLGEDQCSEKVNPLWVVYLSSMSTFSLVFKAANSDPVVSAS